MGMQPEIQPKGKPPVEKTKGAKKMTEQELKRLNDLMRKFESGPEYDEFMDLRKKAVRESNIPAERSKMGEINGKVYYLVLPMDKLELCTDGWKYRRRGFDLEIIDEVNHTKTLFCQALCKRDVKYFVDMFIRDMKEAESNHE